MLNELSAILPTKGRVFGTLVLNPKSMELEDEPNETLTDRMVIILTEVYKLLGYDVVVYKSDTYETRAWGHDESDEQEIMHLANIAFAAFFVTKYSISRTIWLLGRKNILPSTTA